jgi:uncharacterized membrane protein
VLNNIWSACTQSLQDVDPLLKGVSGLNKLIKLKLQTNKEYWEKKNIYYFLVVKNEILLLLDSTVQPTLSLLLSVVFFFYNKLQSNGVCHIVDPYKLVSIIDSIHLFLNHKKSAMASLYKHVKYYKLTSKYSTFNPNHSNSNKFILNQGKLLESFKMDKSFLLTSWTIFFVGPN